MDTEKPSDEIGFGGHFDDYPDAPPPSPEPGQVDAALEADIAAFLTEMEQWNKPPKTAALTLRILADRTRDKERIRKLKKALLHTSVHYHAANHALKYHDGAWKDCMKNACPNDRALLEVQDGK